MGPCFSSPRTTADDLPMTLSHAALADTFITARDSSLWLGTRPYRFASLNAPELLDGDVNGQFEWEDTMETFAAEGGFSRAVTRTYTLRVRSKNVARGHINGWNSSWGDWEWDEPRLVEFDTVLSLARKSGVRLIVPIVNQDFGGEDTNWVGNQTDLVRMRKGVAYEEAKRVDFWTDREMNDGFKLILDKLLNRVNTINGIRVGDDATILAWETGNEMNFQGMRPAPASWTLLVAKHLKHLAPLTLVMDGSFARQDDVNACYPQEVLESVDVDILSYHYYGAGETSRVKADCAVARKYGKVFIAGEYGFYSTAAEYTSFLSAIDSAGGAGSLVWSLRPHSSSGGFKTHGEGDGQWSYHVPGWSQPQHREFDAREESIVLAIRKASFIMNRERVPPFPIPLAPSRVWFVSSDCIAWVGSAWASHYEVVVRDSASAEERVKGERDNVKEGSMRVGLDLGWVAGRAFTVVVRAIGVDGGVSEASEVAR